MFFWIWNLQPRLSLVRLHASDTITPSRGQGDFKKKKVVAKGVVRADWFYRERQTMVRTMLP